MKKIDVIDQIDFLENVCAQLFSRKKNYVHIALKNHAPLIQIIIASDKIEMGMSFFSLIRTYLVLPKFMRHRYCTSSK